MAQRGAPKIDVVDCGGYYMALEGSHRLAAADALGIVSDLMIYEQDQLLDIRRYDWFDAHIWAETIYSARDVAGELWSAHQAVA